MSVWQNAVHLFSEQAKAHPHDDDLAIWCEGESVSFAELAKLATAVQIPLRQAGAKLGDAAIVMEPLSPRLYASVIALMGLGVTVIFAEPWMNVARIEKIIRFTQPRFLVSGWFGRLWSLRTQALRAIPHKISLNQALRSSINGRALEVVDVPDEQIGIVSFTSGTTGDPKGVVRTHGYMRKQLQALDANLHLSSHRRPDLCVFANFALANLALGRGSLLVNPNWSSENLCRLDALSGKLKAETLTCGPAFLRQISCSGLFAELQSVHVGGALTDCEIFEDAFALWPGCQFTHIYGSSEAEPVALCEARKAVKISRDQGFFQTLCVGEPVAEIRHEVQEDCLWVSGDHVAPFYLGSRDDNDKNKKKDATGRLWHNMADRVRVVDDLWFFAGRSNQRFEDFQLEQKIYTLVGSSLSLIHRDAQKGLRLFGENLGSRKKEILQTFPELSDVINLRIRRDPRHRARIDRRATLGSRG